MNSILDLKKFKESGNKISMVTCYDYSFAKAVNSSDVEMILVGDSVAMVMHGFDSTIHATTEMMCTHIAAVKRGAPDKFIVGDMPFLTFRKGVEHSLEVAGKLMQAGSNCIKLEGAIGILDVVENLVESGIPVMGHLGLTPQSVHQLGGHKVQGRSVDAQEQIIQDAINLEKAGCCSIVLECVPQNVAKLISEKLSIPTIGIGAGKYCDGQVLVLQDMLGLTTDFSPRFVRKFEGFYDQTVKALDLFNFSIKETSFPNEKESFLS